MLPFLELQNASKLSKHHHSLRAEEFSQDAVGGFPPRKHCGVTMEQGKYGVDTVENICFYTTDWAE